MPIEFETSDLSLIDNVNAFVDDWNSISDQITVQTSGSTGKPKSITLLKELMIASANATGTFLGLKPGDTALLCLSPDTIGGKMMLVRSIVLDLQLIVVDVDSSPLKLISKSIDFAAMVPMQVQKCITENPEKLALLEQLIIGGAPVSEALITQLEGVEANIYHTFGMTETISHIALRKLNHPLEAHFNLLPNIKIQVNEESCLLINAPQLGVLNLQTNDLVELIGSTKFRWLGRKDFVINSGGIKLHPEEIESKLSKSIQVPFFVSGLQDERLGEKLVLHVEQDSPISITKSEFSTILGKHQIPKEIYYYSTFQFTKSGKIDRLATIKKSTSVAREVL